MLDRDRKGVAVLATRAVSFAQLLQRIPNYAIKKPPLGTSAGKGPR